jgi:thiosulfate/3-mercaptopyruvate sulfurtransferase
MNNPAKSVSAQWLFEHLGDPNVKVIDASWYLPGAEMNAHEMYEEGHIPGAVQFDIDTIEAPGTDLPHMLANEADFAEGVGKLGIKETDTIVIYDNIGVFMAASRVWYNFHIMGAKNVRLMLGGKPAWDRAGYFQETGRSIPKAVTFNAKFDASRVKSLDDIRQIITDGSAQILDARARERFAAEVEESTEGVRAGHMPGAINVPYNPLMRLGEFKDKEALRAIFDEAGVDLSRPIVTTCGSGVTACVINFALDMLGHEDHAMYDGSWTEWGIGDVNEVVKGK